MLYDRTEVPTEGYGRAAVTAGSSRRQGKIRGTVPLSGCRASRQTLAIIILPTVVALCRAPEFYRLVFDSVLLYIPRTVLYMHVRLPYSPSVESSSSRLQPVRYSKTSSQSIDPRCVFMCTVLYIL